jgi:branched-chain amino acid transport system substrate-binding protein
MKFIVAASLTFLAAASAAPASAQDIVMSDVAELSGGGATVGTNWKNGIDMAVEEINAAGGVLGHKLVVSHADSQSNPGVARALVQKALDSNPYVLLGPGYSGSVKATAPLAAEAGVTQIMGGEAAELTQMGDKFLFRTSFGQQSTMPKVAKYMAEDMKAKSVAVVWVNNDFGHGGRDMIEKSLQALGVTIAADISTEAGQVDFAADVAKVKASNADAAFVYLNEDESARILKEFKRQNVTTPLMGETTLVGQKVIDLAGDAANGARAHVGLTTDAPVAAVKAFRDRFVAKYNYVPDHNGLKGYLAIQMVKAATEKMGKVDPKGIADALHGLTIKAADDPGILMDVTFDENGDIDREGFLVEVVDGKQVIKQILPKLH